MKTLIAAILAAATAFPALADWKPLFSPAGAAAAIEAEETVIVDIRTPAAYAKGHLEGAVNIPYAAWRGPETNPGALIPASKLTLILTEAGIEPDMPVLITHQGSATIDFGSAARVYWTLKSAGIQKVAILNGGVTGWTAAGNELSTAEGTNMPSERSFAFGPSFLSDRAAIARVLEGAEKAVLLDARPAAAFAGKETHAMAAAPGTLTGAVNLDQNAWFDGALLVADKARVQAALAKAGVRTDQAIVSFCDTGHWAATNWFVLSEIAGIKGVTLYPESWVGWSRAKAEKLTRR